MVGHAVRVKGGADMRVGEERDSETSDRFFGRKSIVRLPDVMTEEPAGRKVDGYGKKGGPPLRVEGELFFSVFLIYFSYIVIGGF